MSDELTTQLAATVSPIVARAHALEIRTPQDRADVSGFLKAVKTAAAEVHARMDPAVDSAHRAHKEAVALRQSFLQPLNDAEYLAKLKAGKWDRDQAEAAERERQRLQAIENERARREQEKAEQEAARQRAIEAEQRQKAEDARRAAEQANAEEKARLLKEAQEAERKAAAAAVKVEAKEEQAACVVATVVQVAAPVKPKGEATVTRWTAELVSKAQLCGLPEGDVRLTFIAFDQPNANKFAAATKGAVTVPGVKFVPVTSLSVRIN